MRTEDTVTKDSTPMVQQQYTDLPSWYDRGGILRSYLPASNREGQMGRPTVTKEEKERQEWLRWISWIWEARRQGVEGQLPRIIRNTKDNLDPSIREYDIELSRLIFRAITAAALKQLLTEEEMLHGIREGFIVALQLNDTKYFAAEVRDLHQKIGDPTPIRNRMGMQKAVNPASIREFSLEHMTPQEDPLSKQLNQLSLEQTAPAPRRSKYFTREQSEEESDVSAKHQVVIRAARALLPRDIPAVKEKEEMKAKLDSLKETKLTDKVVKQRSRQHKKMEKRDYDPSPSPSSSSTSADERRRRARREKEKERDKKKKKEQSKRRKRASETEDGDPLDDSSDLSRSSSDSDVGNKKPNQKNCDSSLEESDRSERATRQKNRTGAKEPRDSSKKISWLF